MNLTRLRDVRAIKKAFMFSTTQPIAGRNSGHVTMYRVSIHVWTTAPKLTIFFRNFLQNFPARHCKLTQEDLALLLHKFSRRYVHCNPGTGLSNGRFSVFLVVIVYIPFNRIIPSVTVGLGLWLVWRRYTPFDSQQCAQMGSAAPDRLWQNVKANRVKYLNLISKHSSQSVYLIANVSLISFLYLQLTLLTS
jgi:hypothetical protein